MALIRVTGFYSIWSLGLWTCSRLAQAVSSLKSGFLGKYYSNHIHCFLVAEASQKASPVKKAAITMTLVYSLSMQTLFCLLSDLHIHCSDWLASYHPPIPHRTVRRQINFFIFWFIMGMVLWETNDKVSLCIIVISFIYAYIITILFISLMSKGQSVLGVSFLLSIPRWGKLMWASIDSNTLGWLA